MASRLLRSGVMALLLAREVDGRLLSKGRNGLVGEFKSNVRVAAFYETLCPDSQKFIIDEVGPLVASGQHADIDFDFVPYGKVIDGECQHGAPECAGNSLQRCALNSLTRPVFLEFLVCHVSGLRQWDEVSVDDVLLHGEECLRSGAPDAAQAVMGCVSDDNSAGIRAQLLQTAQTETAAARVEFVPLVLVQCPGQQQFARAPQQIVEDGGGEFGDWLRHACPSN